jgi:hypothetical protein
MRSALAAALVLSVAGIGSVHAQTAAATPAQPADVDPARLAAARELLGVMLPAEQRDRIMENMIRPMMANLRQSMLQAPGFGEMLGKDANVAAAFDRFVKGQEDRSVATVKAGMPGMIEAMARAYARRFDTRQIADIRAFFETPSGKAYITASYSIMSDPDVQAWQRDLVARSMAHMQEDIAKFVSDLSASHPPEQK